MNKQAVKSKSETRRRLEQAAARLAGVEGEARDERLRIEQRLRDAGERVKGTRDVGVEARRVTALAGGSLAVRIEVALRASEQPMSLVELAQAIGEPAARVHAALRRLRDAPCPTRSEEHAPDARCVHNHALPGEDPRWSWVVGDEVDTQALYAEIERMLRRRPYTFAELTAATGARRGRISGATVEFARGNTPIWTASDSERRYQWFIGRRDDLPAELRRTARRVKLAPDKNKV
jgi:hypothetical protein